MCSHLIADGCELTGTTAWVLRHFGIGISAKYQVHVCGTSAPAEHSRSAQIREVVEALSVRAIQSRVASRRSRLGLPLRSTSSRLCDQRSPRGHRRSGPQQGSHACVRVQPAGVCAGRACAHGMWAG